MLLEPPHHFAIGTCEIGALELVPRAFDSDERCGHARLRQRRVHRLPFDYRDDPVGATLVALVAIAALGGDLPARRATRVGPALALKPR
jgi:ABC-type lipoprotein release transport system permease subunit